MLQRAYDTLYTVSEKPGMHIMLHNFSKCGPILIFFVYSFTIVFSDELHNEMVL